MKILIFLGVLGVLVASTGALQCWYCENRNFFDCLVYGRVQNCQPNEESCEIEQRRQGTNFLYFKRCKQGHACDNNEIQNPRPAAPTQCNHEAENSVCRCCCTSNLCNRNNTNCEEASTVSATQQTTTPVEVEPTTPTNEPCIICDDVEDWSEFGEVECESSRNDGRLTIGDQCHYTCHIGTRLVGGGTRTCRRSVDFPLIETDRDYVWYPAAPICEPDPEFCLQPPIWPEENQPIGTVTCPAPANGPWELGDRCTFTCPPGYHPEGDEESICQRENEASSAVFAPQRPCCEENCDPNREVDILFVLDRSSSIDSTEWEQMRNFVGGIMDAESVRENTGLRFAIVAYDGENIFPSQFPNGIKISIPFADWTTIRARVPNLPGAREGEMGTWTRTALRYAARTVFGTTQFGERTTAPNVVLFLTDGVTSESEPLPGPLSIWTNELKAVTERVIAVGVGLRNRNELVDIASNERSILETPNFSAINQLLSRLTQISCPDNCP